MAKFDVHRLREGGGLVLDVQADLLDRLNTRLVVPLMPVADAPQTIARLNPVFEVEGRRVAMVTQFAAAVHVRELGDRVISLADEQDAIGNALDMLLVSGF
ncbi:MAG: CcdB family protein [Sphingobium sp.]